jgi:hypothetical protein
MWAEIRRKIMQASPLRAFIATAKALNEPKPVTSVPESGAFFLTIPPPGDKLLTDFAGREQWGTV